MNFTWYHCYLYLPVSNVEKPRVKYDVTKSEKTTQEDSKVFPEVQEAMNQQSALLKSNGLLK